MAKEFPTSKLKADLKDERATAALISKRRCLQRSNVENNIAELYANGRVSYSPCF